MTEKDERAKVLPEFVLPVENYSSYLFFKRI